MVSKSDVVRWLVGRHGFHYDHWHGLGPDPRAKPPRPATPRRAWIPGGCPDHPVGGVDACRRALRGRQRQLLRDPLYAEACRLFDDDDAASLTAMELHAARNAMSGSGSRLRRCMGPHPDTGELHEVVSWVERDRTPCFVCGRDDSVANDPATVTVQARVRREMNRAAAEVD